MLKQKTTILLIGILCFSPVSGLCAVICHGSNGYITVEPVDHNHCECPKTVQTGNRDKFAGTAIGLSTNHDHCKDTLVTSSLAVSAQKNIKLPTHKIIAANFLLKPVSSHTASFSGYLSARCTEFSSFFTPLRTVILLA
jgi:hypothetical protein